MSGTCIQHATFPVPVFGITWPDSGEFNQQLETVILREQKADPGIVRSNVDSWHSSDKLLLGQEQWQIALRKRIKEVLTPAIVGKAVEGQELFDGWSVYGWANVNPSGGSNRPHVHPDSIWSGVYYVSDCSAIDGGDIIFSDSACIPVPKHASGQSFREFRIKPEAGQMLLFPSTLIHRVDPHQSSTPRISVAFNLSHESWELASAPWVDWKSFLWMHLPEFASKCTRWKQNALSAVGVKRASTAAPL